MLLDLYRLERTAPWKQKVDMIASLSFTGAAARLPKKALAAALSLVGSIPTRAISRNLAGTLTFSGGLVRSITHKMTGTLSFTGNHIVNWIRLVKLRIVRSIARLN